MHLPRVDGFLLTELINCFILCTGATKECLQVCVGASILAHFFHGSTRSQQIAQLQCSQLVLSQRSCSAPSKAWPLPVDARVARTRTSRLASVEARHWCRWRVLGVFLAYTTGIGALPRLLPRPRALVLAFLFSKQAVMPYLPSRVCCRPVWQLDPVRFFGENGAFFVLARATFDLRTLCGTTESCVYFACTFNYHATLFLIVFCLVWRCKHCSRRRVFTPKTLPCTAARAPAAAPSCSAERPVGASRPPH